MWDDMSVIDRPFSKPLIEQLAQHGIYIWEGNPWTGAKGEFYVEADPSRFISR